MMTDAKEEPKAAEDVEVQAGTTTTTTTEEKQGGVTMGKIHISDAQVPFVGMFFCGLILLVAVLSPGRTLKYWAYGISLASVAMVMAMVGFFLTFNENLNGKVGKFNAYFLFLWCFIGACIMTFSGPFLNTGNGYFASWGLAVASVMGVGVTGEEAKSVVGKMGALLGLGAASIVVIIAISPEIRANVNRNIGIYTLTLACVTLIIVGVFQKMESIKGKLKFITLAFFAIMWIVCACLCTFEGPFLITGNGYFGVWGATIACILASMAALKE